MISNFIINRLIFSFPSMVVCIIGLRLAYKNAARNQHTSRLVAVACSLFIGNTLLQIIAGVYTIYIKDTEDSYRLVNLMYNITGITSVILITSVLGIFLRAIFSGQGKNPSNSVLTNATWFAESSNLPIDQRLSMLEMRLKEGVIDKNEYQKLRQQMLNSF